MQYLKSLYFPFLLKKFEMAINTRRRILYSVLSLARQQFAILFRIENCMLAEIQYLYQHFAIMQKKPRIVQV